MKRIVLLLWIVAMGGIAPRAMAAAPRQGAVAGKVLFRWKAPARHNGPWRSKNGVLSYSGASTAGIYPGYTVPHGTDFAVQAHLRGAGPGGADVILKGFGLVARPAAASTPTGVEAGSFFSSQNAREDTNPEIYWNGQTAGGAAFSPKKGWHLYRLEVRGSQFTLLIDGTQMVNYTIADYTDPTRVGIFSRFYRLEARDFEVMTVSATLTPVMTVPALKQMNLTVADLPVTGFYLPTLSHWYPNEEIARERNLSLSALQAAGSIVSYGTDFFARSREVSDIYSQITAYGTPAQALADNTARVQVLRATFRQLVPVPTANYHDLTGIAVGDASDGFRFDASSGGIEGRYVFLYFSRGRFAAHLTVVFDPTMAPDADKSVALVTALARIMDQRMQQAG